MSNFFSSFFLITEVLLQPRVIYSLGDDVSRFSQRMGFSPAKVVQIDSMDSELRIGLWNALQCCYWDIVPSETLDFFAKVVWFDYFKLPIDKCPDFYVRFLDNSLSERCAYMKCREYFLSSDTKWWEIYDFVEFTLKNIEIDENDLRDNINFFNNVLERENSGYRFVGIQLLAVSDENEIKIIEDIREEENNNVSTHLKSALSMLADRKNPDYRNSIKESISAVESLCCYLSGKSKIKFSDALTEIDKKSSFHPSLRKAFLNLYGYTSDNGGIRHALTDKSIHPSYADAKFMLVTCSAFCNFLKAKKAESDQL